MINDEPDVWDRPSSKEGNLRLLDQRLKHECLYLYFLPLLYFLQALLMAKIAYHCLKNTKGWPRYLKDVSCTRAFCVNHAGSANLFSFLFVNSYLFRSFCQIANDGTLLPQNKAGEGLVERKKRRKRSIWLQLEHGIQGETPSRTSPAHKPHISLFGFYLISSFEFHTNKDEGIMPQTLHLSPVRAAHRLTACRFENKKKVLQ